MASIVIDSSVLMAILQGEPITVPGLPSLKLVRMSAVNVAEVYTLLTQTQPATRHAGIVLMGLLQRIEPFTAPQARLAGEFRRFGKHVSLGDRACLALAVELQAEVYTADREWATFNSGLKIHLIR